MGALQEAMGQLEGALENLETRRRQKFEEESSPKGNREAKRAKTAGAGKK